jgi:hypothetical protein
MLSRDGESRDTCWVDVACVCVVPSGWSGCFESCSEDNSTSTSPIFLWSEELRIPPASERPFEEGPNGEWSALKDPHIVLTDGVKSRSQFLQEVIKRLVPLLVG